MASHNSESSEIVGQTTVFIDWFTNGISSSKTFNIDCPHIFSI